MEHQTTLDGRTLKECSDRLRRIETRLTRYLETQGFETEVQKPRFYNGTLEIPTVMCSMRDCIDAVPASWSRNDKVDVYHKGTFVMSFFVKP